MKTIKQQIDNIKDYSKFELIENVYSSETVVKVLKAIWGFMYVDDIETCFEIYKTTTLSNFIKSYESMNLTYGVIENYNRDEINTTITDKAETAVNHEQSADNNITTVETSTINTTDISSQQKASHYTTTYDSSMENRLESYDTTAPTETTTTTAPTNSTTSQSRNYTDITSYNKIQDDEKNNVVEYTRTKNTTKGNIGVTTSQQMINQELELRKRNILVEYLQDFIATYCFYTTNEG